MKDIKYQIRVQLSEQLWVQLNSAINVRVRFMFAEQHSTEFNRFLVEQFRDDYEEYSTPN